MSISLTTGFNLVLNGATVENDQSGACQFQSIDFANSIATFEFRVGSITGNTLVDGVIAKDQGRSVTMTVNLITGAWVDTNGHSGTIGAGPLNSFNTQMKALRNSSEVFAAGASGIMPGTQVPWP